jgi:anti-anti-sigma factor
MTIQVDDSAVHEVGALAASAYATAEPYVHPPTRVLVRSQSPLSGFSVVTGSVTGHLDLVGEFDFACADQFRIASAAILAGDATEAVVDLTRLEFIDARGINILIEFANSLAVRGATLRLINADARIRRVFAICGLDAMVTAAAAPSRDEEST